jgi:cobalt/nickel transport system permease protein
MHIEIGIIDPLRIVAANAAAAAVVASQVPAVLKAPAGLVKTGLAAVGFSILMQAWHLPVGPSELHLIGATTVYLLFGFAPTMVGFALGLLMQALLFEPADMAHLGVNALSLMVPLAIVHYTFGARLFAGAAGDRFSLGKVLRIDALYYAGVGSMVAFWLGVSNPGFALSSWMQWMLAYLPVVGIEILLTFAVVSALRRRAAQGSLVAAVTEIPRLRFA